MDEKDSLMTSSASATRARRWCSAAVSRATGARARSSAGGRPTVRIRTAGGITDRHFCPVLEFIESRDCNNLAGLQSLHGGNASVGGPNRDVLHGSGLIGLDEVHKSALGVSLDGCRRSQRGILLGIHQQSCIHKLIGKQS